MQEWPVCDVPHACMAELFLKKNIYSMIYDAGDAGLRIDNDTSLVQERL